MNDAQPRLLASTLGSSLPSLAEDGLVIRRTRKSRYASDVPPTEPMNPHRPKRAPLYRPAAIRCRNEKEPSAKMLAGNNASLDMIGDDAVDG